MNRTETAGENTPAVTAPQREPQPPRRVQHLLALALGATLVISGPLIFLSNGEQARGYLLIVGIVVLTSVTLIALALKVFHRSGVKEANVILLTAAICGALAGAAIFAPVDGALTGALVFIPVALIIAALGMFLDKALRRSNPLTTIINIAGLITILLIVILAP